MPDGSRDESSTEATVRAVAQPMESEASLESEASPPLCAHPEPESGGAWRIRLSAELAKLLRSSGGGVDAEVVDDVISAARDCVAAASPVRPAMDKAGFFRVVSFKPGSSEPPRTFILVEPTYMADWVRRGSAKTVQLALEYPSLELYAHSKANFDRKGRPIDGPEEARVSPRDRLRASQLTKNMLQEVYLVRRLRGGVVFTAPDVPPRISRSHLHTITPLARCSLLDFINREGAHASASSWMDSCVSIMTDLVFDLAHLHLNRVAHLDIKPANVLLYWDKERGKLAARVADFDLSVHFQHRPLPSKKKPFTIKPRGTLAFAEPEFCDRRGLIESFEQLAKVDVYGLGVTLASVFQRKKPRVVQLEPDWARRRPKPQTPEHDAQRAWVEQKLRSRRVPWLHEGNDRIPHVAAGRILAMMTRPRWQARPSALELVEMISELSAGSQLERTPQLPRNPSCRF